MNTLLVERVEPYTPGDESASVTLRSAGGEVVAFCYPCKLLPGDRIHNHLSVLDAVVQAAYLSDWPEPEKNEKSKERLLKVGPYAYQGCGVVIDQGRGLVEVLGFQIELGEVPCEGHVEFEITRLDV